MAVLVVISQTSRSENETEILSFLGADVDGGAREGKYLKMHYDVKEVLLWYENIGGTSGHRTTSGCI